MSVTLDGVHRSEPSKSPKPKFAVGKKAQDLKIEPVASEAVSGASQAHDPHRSPSQDLTADGRTVQQLGWATSLEDSPILKGISADVKDIKNILESEDPEPEEDPIVKAVSEDVKKIVDAETKKILEAIEATKEAIRELKNSQQTEKNNLKEIEGKISQLSNELGVLSKAMDEVSGTANPDIDKHAMEILKKELEMTKIELELTKGGHEIPQAFKHIQEQHGKLKTKQQENENKRFPLNRRSARRAREDMFFQNVGMGSIAIGAVGLTASIFIPPLAGPSLGMMGLGAGIPPVQRVAGMVVDAVFWMRNGVYRK